MRGRSKEQLHALLDKKHKNWQTKTGLVKALSKDGRTEWVLEEHKTTWEDSKAEDAVAKLTQAVPQGVDPFFSWSRAWYSVHTLLQGVA